MPHKVHPKAFRIKEIEDWNARGFYGKKMPQYLEEDFLIKDFLRKKLEGASVASIQIERSADNITIIIETARPGLIIGRGGGGVELLKKQIERYVKRKLRSKKNLAKSALQEYYNRKLSDKMKIEIREIKNPWASAALVAQMAAQQIEKRVPYRQVLKKSIERVMTNKEIKGIRMEVSGRLNGIEIARSEWLSQGKMPRNTLRADIDYAQDEAHCTYGKIGIKVWLYKGEKFD